MQQLPNVIVIVSTALNVSVLSHLLIRFTFHHVMMFNVIYSSYKSRNRAALWLVMCKCSYTTQEDIKC